MKLRQAKKIIRNMCKNHRPKYKFTTVFKAITRRSGLNYTPLQKRMDFYYYRICWTIFI